MVDGRDAMCRGAYVIRSAVAERGFERGAPISRPRVLLVGEAAGLDIATGEGIAQAIEYGAAAGRYLARAFDRDDVRFADWGRFVDLDHVGWQLRIRHACFRAFYGPHRPRVERMLPRLGPLFQVGARDFAGKPQQPLEILRGGALLFGALVRDGLGRSPHRQRWPTWHHRAPRPRP